MVWPSKVGEGIQADGGELEGGGRRLSADNRVRGGQHTLVLRRTKCGKRGRKAAFSNKGGWGEIACQESHLLFDSSAGKA